MKTSILKAGTKSYKYYSIKEYAEENGFDITTLPFSLKVLLENLLRNSDKDYMKKEDLAALANWKPSENNISDISFHPTRVIMQDLTGGAALADLAAMRNAISDAGGDSSKINPLIPVDMIIDHSVMVDFYGTEDAFQKNVELEFERNKERYRFFKWGQQAFDNFRVVPPGTGIIHQVNLEYLASVVTVKDDESDTPLVFPDTVVGTDSHTTMINGLSVLGWGVGGIEAEAAMLGQPLTMLIPNVVGFKLSGKLSPGITATDLVLKIVQILRAYGVVGSFVEFFGSGLENLSLADRATISNMAPEYGATCGFFPIDNELLHYLQLSGREKNQINLVEAYAKAQGLWRDDEKPASYSHVLDLDISTIKPAMAGPRRPQDLVLLTDVSTEFDDALEEIYTAKNVTSKVKINNIDHDLTHGDVVIASITSCTNTSNPAVLIAAGLIAKKAVELGLTSKEWVKTSFAPGSQVVTSYLEAAGLMKYLDKIGFNLTGYGCSTCIGNSGPLPPAIKDAILSGDLITANILSGNRNFEGRVSPESKASYLASPPLVVIYALAGSIRINLEKDPIGTDKEGKSIFLKDIWPSESDIKESVNKFINPEMFNERYRDVFTGSEEWQKLEFPEGNLYDWEVKSTYIRKPPFFESFMEKSKSKGIIDIEKAKCLGIFPDSTTTDHISPAGNIATDSPAGRYLLDKKVDPSKFNSYGSRRANHEVMMRGTFANIRIKNRMLPGIEGGYTKNNTGETAAIYDAAMSWEDAPLIVFAGKEYGTGSSRDWAAKGPSLQGVKVVIAESYERIHRSNLLGMGILPLEFSKNDSIDSLEISGDESFSIKGLNKIEHAGILDVKMEKQDGITTFFPVKVRIDTKLELEYWKAGGILNFVLLDFMK
ncbi:MAG: aconitate hydratase AcnA [Spirochaetia bacterium]|jgi:aconitate hydratase|nr:aconitate hydratase AcnA [Spirochaetia bacterium]